MGYHLAGFDVVGVDRKPQRRFPFEFVQGNALEVLADAGFMAQFDAVHASPPCQAHTIGAAQRWGGGGAHPRLIGATRTLLQQWGGPWVIENVETARSELQSPIMLCGTQFGLGVFRHRLFELSPTVPRQVERRHERHTGRVGDGTYFTVTGQAGGTSNRDGYYRGTKADWEEAMGIHWMTVDQLSAAIPPAYTRYVGELLAAAVPVAAAA